jgi:hypothetical protein
MWSPYGFKFFGLHVAITFEIPYLRKLGVLYSEYGLSSTRGIEWYMIWMVLRGVSILHNYPVL